MADVDVSLKFEYVPDPAKIRTEIEDAIKTINGNPPKVKVAADITEAKKNLDALQKQITALTKQKVTLNIGAGAGGSNAKPKDLVKDTVAYNNALAALNNAMTQTRNKMKNWSAAATGNSSSAYNSLNTQIKAMENLENRIKSGGVSVKDFAKEFSEIKASVAEASNEVAKFQENTKATSVSVEDETRAYKKLFSMFSDIDKIKSKWSTKAGVSNTDEYKNILGNEEALQKLYEGYKDGSKTFEQFREGLVNIESDLAKNKANLAETGQAFGNFGSGIMQAAQQIGTFLVSYRMVMMAFQNIKKMIAASIEIESSMNRIQIVTGATDSQMTQFFETAASHAKELGTSISEVAGSIEVFSRLGLTNRPLVQ